MGSFTSEMLVYHNGRCYSPEEPIVTMLDRSFLYGDSIYEVVTTSKQKPIELEDHLYRLARSAEAIELKLPAPLSKIATEINQVILEYQKRFPRTKTELYVRIVISRGVGKISFTQESVEGPAQIYYLCMPTPTWGTQYKFMSLGIVERQRLSKESLSPAIKGGNYLNCILSLLEAKRRGSSDALMCDAQGFITEGTTFNIFYIKRGILVTPPLDVSILDGIIRRMTLKTARALGYETREIRFLPEHLYNADEIFISSTSRNLMKINEIIDLRGKKPVTHFNKDTSQFLLTDLLNDELLKMRYGAA